MTFTPSTSSGPGPVLHLIAAMDEEIARLYAERGLGHVRPRFVLPLLRLHHDGPVTVGALAASTGVTHSAMSQTVSAMRSAGLVDSAPGPDARTRTVDLTDAARDLVGFLDAEWRATEAAWDEVQAGLSTPLQQVVEEMTAALQRESFRDRIARHL
ncbi:MarR family winged helix-turn-helix transcriptional regulator [Kineococcus sp. SYSU DK003]|uniref:MarR family winged helix-turn-helix transcriptional regulator n=1 Tax=Kineococcus sp. SYSU DK003 TaxID=3383124 RepID=UPI003D7D7973